MDYDRDYEFRVGSLMLIHKGRRYPGHGVLTWRPTEGFHLLAFLDESTPPRPQKISFGGSELTHTSAVRMVVENHGVAVAPRAFVEDNLALGLSASGLYSGAKKATG